jgi:hypothetical protein
MSTYCRCNVTGNVADPAALDPLIVNVNVPVICEPLSAPENSYVHVPALPVLLPLKARLLRAPLTRAVGLQQP